MQAQRHQEWVDHGNNNGEDDGGVAIEPEERRAQAGTDPHAQRADEEGRDRHHNAEGQEGHEDHLDIVRNDLDQALVDQGEHCHHHERDEDLTAVLVELHGQTCDMRDTQFRVERLFVGRA